VDRAEEGQLSPAATGRVIFVALAAVVFVVDRLTKGLVAANIPLGTEQQVLPFLWIANTENSGAAFGLGRNATLLFLAASVVIAILLIGYAIRNRLDAFTGLVLGLVLGGTLGNGYDRLFHGQVTDFLNLHWWPVFNVADSAISVGMVLLILGYVIRHRNDSSA
jgi:signal peptidase II